MSFLCSFVQRCAPYKLLQVRQVVNLGSLGGMDGTQRPLSGLSLIDLSPAMEPVLPLAASEPSGLMMISSESIGQFMWWTSCNLGTEARAAIELDDLTL